MDFNPMGMGSLSEFDAARPCLCYINGFGCGTKLMRTICICDINGCGCGWGNPGTA